MSYEIRDKHGAVIYTHDGDDAREALLAVVGLGLRGVDFDGLIEDYLSGASQEDMTVDYVRRGVDYVRLVSGDPEHGHWADDELRDAVLTAIAAGADNAKELAAEALKTNDLGLTRWYA